MVLKVKTMTWTWQQTRRSPSSLLSCGAFSSIYVPVTWSLPHLILLAWVICFTLGKVLYITHLLLCVCIWVQGTLPISKHMSVDKEYHWISRLDFKKTCIQSLDSSTHTLVCKYTRACCTHICAKLLFSCTPPLTAASGEAALRAPEEAVIKQQPSACAWATEHNKNSFPLINFYGWRRGHVDTCLMQCCTLFLTSHIHTYSGNGVCMCVWVFVCLDRNKGECSKHKERWPFPSNV